MYRHAGCIAMVISSKEGLDGCDIACAIIHVGVCVCVVTGDLVKSLVHVPVTPGVFRDNSWYLGPYLLKCFRHTTC